MHPAPDHAALEALLEQYAAFAPVPLCPELSAWFAHDLVDIWSAAERLAGRTMEAPFWAWPWAAGQALARVILDQPERVRGLRVLDFGAGGGVASLACARAGAASVIANDVDPWALAVTRSAAKRQALDVRTLCSDLTQEDAAARSDHFDVVLCSDLAYDRSRAPRERALLERFRAMGARLLIADAGRTYFEAAGLQRIASYRVTVPEDLEGKELKIATVYAG